MIAITGPNQQIPLFQQVKQQGGAGVQLIGANLTLTPKARQGLGKAAYGILFDSWAWDTADTSKPFIKQFFAELKANHAPAGPLDVDLISLSGWAGMHMLADALKTAKLKGTAANVPKALQNAAVPTISAKYGLNPLDYRKNAFATNPVLSKLRLFSNSEALFKIDNKGKIVPLAQTFQNVLHLFKIK
jgi:hypothetical protein